MKRFKIFFLNSILMICTSLILQIIRLIFNIYISNKISSEALGCFQLIMVTYMFGITLASSGINISCMRIVSEEYALNNNQGIIKSSKRSILISIILSFITSLFFYINSDFIVYKCFQNKVSTNIIYLICLSLPLISISSAITGYFMAVRRIYKTILGQFLEQFSKIVIIIILLHTYATETTLEKICFSLILGDMLSELISFIYLICIYVIDIKKYFKINTQNVNKNYTSRILKILFPVATTSCIKSGISTVKQLIIPSSLKKNGKNLEDAISDYGMISAMAMPIVMFPSTFLITVAGLLIPEFSRYYIKNDFKKIRSYTDKLLIGSFLFASSLTIIFFTYGNKLGNFIYHNNIVGTYIKIFSLIIPFMYVDIIIDNILKGLDAQTEVMVINIIDLIISTIFIFFFVPIMGISGYIISIFISEIINLILSLYKLLKIEKNMKKENL